MLHGSRSYVLADADGQVLESHSISAGLDYPGVGPEHSYLKDTGRARYEPVTDAEALAAFHMTCVKEGIIPALESAHAVALALRQAGPGEIWLVGLSGCVRSSSKSACQAARSSSVRSSKRQAVIVHGVAQ